MRKSQYTSAKKQILFWEGDSKKPKSNFTTAKNDQKIHVCDID